MRRSPFTVAVEPEALEFTGFRSNVRSRPFEERRCTVEWWSNGVLYRAESYVGVVEMALGYMRFVGVEV